jgi:hypothetical protein
MAKQTFTTGQVLTAAQMTSLQQTAMGGGAATAKTASYVLVGADAGTTVAMNAAGATTITVNTGLFAAGDTVFIQNLGAGACTVTAGTATVATAGSLILPQNDAGILYFTATGTAIFYDYIQTGAVSPLTTKGDVYTFSTSDARLGVGANNTVLTADSAEATGLKWATPAGGGSMTLINSGGTTLTGASVTISSIPATYNTLQLQIVRPKPASDGNICVRFNGDTGSYYKSRTAEIDDVVINNDRLFISNEQDSDTANGFINYFFYDYTNTTGWRLSNGQALTNNKTTPANANFAPSIGIYSNVGTAISSITIIMNGGQNFTSGTAYLYGVK